VHRVIMGYSKLTLTVALAATVLLVSGCSDSGVSDVSESPTVVLGLSELEAWETTATAFFERIHQAWPDLDARFSEHADDAVFYDVTFGDYWVGPDAIIRGHEMMPVFFPDLEAPIKSVFLAANGAVFSVDWVGLWIGTKPADVPWHAGLEVFRFDGDIVTGEENWYTGETLEAGLEGGLSPCGGCSVEFSAMADRYAAAWSSGNPDQVAALYSDDAAFSDSMFGIAVTGADEISQSVADRFGRGGTTMSIQEAYGVTLARSLIARGSPSEAGEVAGVGVRYQWTVDTEDGSTTVESLSLLYFGSVVDGFFEPDPDGLIVTEEVFHNPGTLSNLTP
jgi:ketosteroid isomerase-like protein